MGVPLWEMTPIFISDLQSAAGGQSVIGRDRGGGVTCRGLLSAALDGERKQAVCFGKGKYCFLKMNIFDHLFSHILLNHK